LIIQRTSNSTLAIRQDDHAAFAAFMLEHWSDHKFPKHPHRDEILRATRYHDAGWIDYDAHPRLDEKTGLPVDFMHTTPEETFEVWRRGTAQFLESEPFVALLITHHAYALHESTHKRDGAWKEFFTMFAQQRAELRSKLGLTQNMVESSYSFLRMSDWFSLAYCLYPELGAEKAEQYSGYNFKRDGSDGNEYLFRPYPFDERDLSYDLPIYPLNPSGYKHIDELIPDLQTPQYQSIHLNPLERFAK
jgi:hypothetical protein